MEIQRRMVSEAGTEGPLEMPSTQVIQGRRTQRSAKAQTLADTSERRFLRKVCHLAGPRY